MSVSEQWGYKQKLGSERFKQMLVHFILEYVQIVGGGHSNDVV